MVKKLDLLSVDEARQVRDKIHALREYWIPRAGKALPFFTLGTASYLDKGEEGSTIGTSP